MRNIQFILIVFITLTLVSCASNLPESEVASNEQSNSLSKDGDPTTMTDSSLGVVAIDTTILAPVVDSFELQMDSLLKAKISLPPVYQREIFEANTEATSKFADLAKLSKGKLKIVVSSSVVVSEIVQTIKKVSLSESDIVLLIDRTGSMADDMEYVKRGAAQIFDTLKKYQGTRLAIATYGDKNWDKWSPWFLFKNFETDYDSAQMYLQKLGVVSNEDWPESVYDAIVECLKSDFWKSTKKRTIILVGDAPPQEKPMSSYSLEDVIAKSKEMKIRMNFYPILITPDIHQVKLSQQDMDKYKVVENNTTLFPNPSKGIINLSMKNTSTYNLELYNANGEIVMNDEFFGVFWTKDISHLPNGMYIMRVIAEDHTYELMKLVLHQ